MPTFSQSLEQSLHRALAIANERHHQYATLEHLVAYGTQQMFFVFPDGPPPPEELVPITG